MPSRLNQNPTGIRFDARINVAPVPLPMPIAYSFGIGIFARADRIVDNHQISAKAGNAGANARRLVLSLLSCFTRLVKRTARPGEAGLRFWV
jgi:hypothetical protein